MNVFASPLEPWLVADNNEHSNHVGGIMWSRTSCLRDQVRSPSIRGTDF
jgi:hypothetical protein